MVAPYVKEREEVEGARIQTRSRCSFESARQTQWDQARNATQVSPSPRAGVGLTMQPTRTDCPRSLQRPQQP